MSTFASNTQVTSDKSRAEIERTLRRYGADHFGYMSGPDSAVIGFQAAGRRVKAKLEAVEAGITTFEEEFMAHIVLPDGTTMADQALPYIEAAYNTGSMPALLSFDG